MNQAQKTITNHNQKQEMPAKLAFLLKFQIKFFIFFISNPVPATKPIIIRVYSYIKTSEGLNN